MDADRLRHYREMVERCNFLGYASLGAIIAHLVEEVLDLEVEVLDLEVKVANLEVQLPHPPGSNASAPPPWR